jgi:hypothetical protein
MPAIKTRRVIGFRLHDRDKTRQGTSLVPEISGHDPHLHTASASTRKSGQKRPVSATCRRRSNKCTSIQYEFISVTAAAVHLVSPDPRSRCHNSCKAHYKTLAHHSSLDASARGSRDTEACLAELMSQFGQSSNVQFENDIEIWCRCFAFVSKIPGHC